MVLSRRKALFGLLAAPAIIKTAGLLMPIKPRVIKPFRWPILSMSLGWADNEPTTAIEKEREFARIAEMCKEAFNNNPCIIRPSLVKGPVFDATQIMPQLNYRIV